MHARQGRAGVGGRVKTKDDYIDEAVKLGSVARSALDYVDSIATALAAAYLDGTMLNGKIVFQAPPLQPWEVNLRELMKMQYDLGVQHGRSIGKAEAMGGRCVTWQHTAQCDIGQGHGAPCTCR